MVARQIDRITDSGIIAILRGMDTETTVDVASAVVDGGVTALEVTADTPNVLETIEMLSDSLDDVLIGAGTVLDSETARAVQLAGAEFVVTPTVDHGVIETCSRYGTPVAAGAFTPTEALRAYEAGAEFVKVFPASTGGPDHVRALRGSLSQISLITTGGTLLENAQEYFDAGATALGVGSLIVDLGAAQRNDFETIHNNAAAFTGTIAKTR
jgi:2-dehydro-3-deoxyphosphogluconate aldolase/(4S)-4-hydroxy-2-oxoglutarate aldolase